MNSRLQSINLILNRGYLLVNKDDSRIVKAIVSQLEELISMTDEGGFGSDYLEHSFNKFLASLKLIRTPAFDAEVSIHISNTLRRLFNETLERCQQSLQSKRKPKMNCQPVAVLRDMTRKAYFKRINIVDHYHELYQQYGSELSEENDAKSYEKMAVFFQSYDIYVAAKQNAISVLKNSDCELGGHISVRRAALLVWKAIEKLSPQEISQAQEKFAQTLSEIRKITPEVAPLFFSNFIACLPERGQAEIDNRDDIIDCLHLDFEAQLKDKIHELHVDTQIKILKTLVDRDKELEIKPEDEEDNKFKWDFSRKIKPVLFEKYGAYNFIDGVDVSKEIDKAIDVYFEGKEAHHHLRGVFIEELQRVDNKPEALLAHKKLLIACLQTEPRDPDIHSTRNVAIDKFIFWANVATLPEVNELCARYKKLHETDFYSLQYQHIVKERRRPDMSTAYKVIDGTLNAVDASLQKTYRELHRVQLTGKKPAVDSNLNHDHGIQSLIDRVEYHQNKLYSYHHNRVALYSSAFLFSSKYHSITQRKDKNVFDQVEAIFSDYISGRWKFHWGRSHNSEAEELAIEMRTLSRGQFSMQKVNQAILKIRDVLNRLVLLDNLNVGGSFSRRAEFCLRLLEDVSKKNQEMMALPKLDSQPLLSKN